MSHTHDIDNEDEPLFQFDTYEVSPEAAVLEGSSRFPLTSTACGVDLPHDRSPSASSQSIFLNHHNQAMAHESTQGDRKGKGVSMPMPIRPQAIPDDLHDIFDMSPSNRATHPLSSNDVSSSLTLSPLDFSSLQTPLDDVHHIITSYGRESGVVDAGSYFDDEVHVSDEPIIGKGKAREIPPTLPPLQFTPTEFGYTHADWPSPGLITSTPGPSSFGSAFGSLADPPSTSHEIIEVPATAPPLIQMDSAHAPIVRRMPSRRRSFSNLSMHSTRSLASQSISRIKVKMGLSKGPGNLARKLFRKREGSIDFSYNARLSATLPGNLEVAEVGVGSCFMPWRGNRDSTSPPPLSPGDLDVGLSASQSLPVYRSSFAVLHEKGRSYSSPLPMSAMDYIPVISNDVFVSIPIPVIRDSFGEMLPRELKLQILLSLVSLHEAEHERMMADGEWTAAKATSSKNKWVGRDKGVRELIRLSRVSKSWQSLVFDGQLWTDMSLTSFPRMPSSLLLRLASLAGGFIRTLDFSGHTRLQPSTLLEITNLCVDSGLTASFISCTQLTTVNLQGCSALNTRSLNHLLMSSPSLLKVCLKGLSAVTKTTCDILSNYCTNIISLDISRCPNVDGDAIQLYATAAIGRGEHLPLKELRLAGLTHFSDDVLAALGEAAPDLEVLDLSYIRSLHNSALEAFVACNEDEPSVETVLLTSREAGRDPNDSRRHRRRITRLRHLSLSSCILLTDIACSNLAHAVPHLEFFELAGIGGDLKDDGLICLLRTTPYIRKLDLEDACEITDNFLSAITPSGPEPNSRAKTTPLPEPGHALEHLAFSYAANITDDALCALIRGCTRLRVLEADNTRMSGLALKEFVKTARARKMANSRVAAIDCRSIGENIVRDLAGATRPREGWRAYKAKKLAYLDGRDQEELKVGQDECDEARVVLKSFYSWQTVDAVRAAREKKRKATSRRMANESSESVSGAEDVLYTSGRSRWWSPGGRRSSGTNSPTVIDGNDRDGCRIM